MINNVNVITKISDYFKLKSNNTLEVEEIESKCKENKVENEELCGRPLGIKFNKLTKKLVIIDSYLGIFEYDFNSNNLTQIVKPTDHPFQMKFINHLDISIDGTIYFTDSSTRYRRKDHLDEYFENKNNGRVFYYNPSKKGVTKILEDLSFPNGVALSTDQKYLFISLTNRYQINGQLKGNHEVFINILPCVPDNLNNNGKGLIWVGCYSKRSMLMDFLRNWSKVTMFISRIDHLTNYKFSTSFVSKVGIAIAFNETNGNIEKIILDESGKHFNKVSEVKEKDGFLYMGTVKNNFLTRIKLKY